jgi:anti-sigma factor RsiW
MSACPDKLLLLHAHVDGELDAANALVLEAHLRSCTACTEELARIEAVRAMLSNADLSHATPAALRARIETLAEAPSIVAPVFRPPSSSAANPRRGAFGLTGGGAMPLGRSWAGGLLRCSSKGF